jgi:prepilin-type N-terminal cleavage/methylation domain-containing protein
VTARGTDISPVIEPQRPAGVALSSAEEEQLMLARIRKSMEERDEGFTLIELLVVMIIIGILSAIAIPVFLTQREKARDSAVKADVSTVGKEIATYFVDNTNTTSLAVGKNAAGTRWQLSGGALTAPQDLGAVSNGVTLIDTVLTDANTWCVAMQNTAGAQDYFMYSSANGLTTATSAGCA